MVANLQLFPPHPLHDWGTPRSNPRLHRRYAGMQSGWFPGVGNLQGWEALPTGRGDYWVRVWMRGEEPQFFRDPMTGHQLRVICDEHVWGYDGKRTDLVQWTWDWERKEVYPKMPSTPRVGIRKRIGMVYLMQDPHDKRIKIGFSCKPRTRWLGLCSATGKRLRVLRLIPCRGSYEAKLHNEFRSDRSYGEWFYPRPDLLRFSVQHHYISWGTGLKLYRR